MMMYMKINILTAFLLLFANSIVAQEEAAHVKAGNKLYKTEKYVDAEVAYRKGLQKNPKSFEATYNLGNALFKQGKNTEAFEQYKNAAALQSDNKEKMAAVFHNAGNALLAEKKIDESINAYKMALKMNPKDDETRYNLAYAQMLRKKQQQNKDKKDDKEKDKEKEKQQQQQQQQQQQEQPKMSKQNAQQILDALMQDEKNTMEKTKKQPVRAKKSAEKDW